MANKPTIVMYFIWIKLLLKQILYHCLILELKKSFKGDTIQERFVSCLKIKLVLGSLHTLKKEYGYNIRG